MKYEVKISGGFAGLTYNYKGTLKPDRIYEMELINELQKCSGNKKDNIADAMLYDIKIVSNKDEYNTQIDDSCMSEFVYDFIDRIKRLKKPV